MKRCGEGEGEEEGKDSKQRANNGGEERRGGECMY